MPVTNIQFWADTLEATRLPEISQDIAVLEVNSIETDALLSAKIQEFNDRLDAHTAGITAAQTQANSAQAAAVEAAGSVTAVDLATQAYINSQINIVRNELTAQVVLAQAQILSNVSAQVTSEMAATVPALTTQLNSALAVADANLATANAHMTAFNTVTDGILNSTLPAFEDLQTTIHSDVATLNGRVNLLLTDFVGDALMPVIDDVRVDAAAEASIAAITATSRMTAGGVSKNPIFTDWSGAEPANADIIVAGTSSFAKNTANARYLNAVDLVGSDATQNGPIIRLDTLANTLDCVPSPERVLVRAEVELVSGSITGGAALKATWGSLVGGVPLSISTLLSNHMTNEVGKVQTIEWYALRTAAFVAGTTPFFQLEIYAVSNLLAATRAACSLRVHRLDFEVVTANSVASLTMGAAVSLSGIQASMIAMRAVAGDAAGSIELVAMSDPTGSASVAKINAKHVEVYASTMRLSDNSNIYPDFDMMDGLFYSSPDAAVITRTGVAAAAIGKNQLNIASNAAARTALSGWFPIEPSVEYLVKGTCWLTGTPVGTATLSIETGSVNASGVVTLISGSNAVVYTRASLGYSASLAEITFIAGSTAKMARFRMARAAGAGSVAAFAGLKMQKKFGAALVVDGSISARHVQAGSMSADDIQVGVMDAKHLKVTQLLKISAGTGALSVGKTSAFDLTNDGIFFGRTLEANGAYGFGLLAGKKVGGVDQYIQATAQSGLKLVNAAHFVTGIATPSVVAVTSSQTITLPAGTKYIDIEAIGGGGGGAGATGDSGPGPIAAGGGGNTVIQLWDGSVNTGVSWTSAGGAGATSIHSADGGSPGQGSELGDGGIPSSSWQVAGGNATGYGAGGAGGTGTEKGGNGGLASLLIAIENYDVSALTAPKLVITVGGAGAGSVGQSTASAGGNGSPGIVKYSARSVAMVPASVIPMQPTFTGTITKSADAALVFPDYGAGLWCLSAQGASGLLLDDVETHLSGAQVRLTQGNYASFISDKTPVDLDVSATAVTYAYQFYKLGVWV